MEPADFEAAQLLMALLEMQSFVEFSFCFNLFYPSLEKVYLPYIVHAI